MTALVLRADARRLPLTNESVDLIVTSPPYFAVRCYTDDGAPLDGQLGQEPTPHEFVDALIAATRECVRVLKPSGSLWVNLGDKYSGAQAQHYSGVSNRRAGDSASFWRRTDPRRTGIPNKSLMGLPWRYAIRCIDELGLVLRAEVIWAKPNGLPESVRDRVRRTHEQWFHFTRSPSYYAAVDEIREPYDPASVARAGRARLTPYAPPGQTPQRRAESAPNPLGRLPGSVWTVPTQPLAVPPELGVDHFAAFPTALPRRIILGWSPPAICTECGEGRRPQVARAELPPNDKLSLATRARTSSAHGSHVGSTLGYTAAQAERRIIGYRCACPEPTAPTRPAVVLDVFGGTGTTAATASALGRIGISVDLSHDYCRLAAWRTTDPAELAKAKGERRGRRRRQPGERQTA